MQYDHDDYDGEMRARQQALARRQQQRGDLSINVRSLLPKPGPKMAMGVIW